MKRKLLSLILVVAVLASMVVLAPSASATETVATVSTSENVVAKPGDTVEVAITMTSDLTLYSYTLGFSYDVEKLTLTNIVDELGDGVMSKSLKNGPSYVAVLGSSPYDAFGWSQTNNVGRDISAGVVIATLVFTVNEGATGDANVEILNLHRDDGFYFNEFVVSSDGKTLYRGDPIDISAAKTTVSVIPADYTSAIAVADDAWDFENGVIYGITDESVAKATGLLTIPSEINGVAVTGIGSLAFNKYMLSTIVIPASVESVEVGAIYNCENLTSVYVLNPNAELATAAIGYEGGVRNGAPRNYFILLNAEETCALTTIYGATGSTAEAYAVAGDGVDYFPFVATASGPNTLSYAGNSFVVGDETVAPGSMVIDGATVVGWSDGEKTYVPGETMSVSGSVALEPVTVVAPTTNTAVDFKLTAPESDLAMRFTSTFAIADYNKLAGLGTVTLGMLITPAAYVAKAGAFTKEALDNLGAANGAYIDIAVDGYYSKTATDYTFAGSIKGFSAKTLAKNPDFASIMYATVTTASGDTITVYGAFNYDANQNIKDIATAFSTSDKLTNTQKGWLVTLIGKFSA